jgi:hypothetical protein
MPQYITFIVTKDSATDGLYFLKQQYMLLF